MLSGTNSATIQPTKLLTFDQKIFSCPALLSLTRWSILLLLTKSTLKPLLLPKLSKPSLLSLDSEKISRIVSYYFNFRMQLLVKRISVYWVNRNDPNEICVCIRGSVQDLDTTVGIFSLLLTHCLGYSTCYHSSQRVHEILWFSGKIRPIDFYLTLILDCLPLTKPKTCHPCPPKL